ncbi:hypothetical protein [Aquimarina algiphila]|uniref:hypothetical protein n=1 Tax=Aquimarina algiphila TaxID=2047982 RepID=UPI00232C8FB3|nr:hypothetical protein [Aquimarina algiphila]
MKDFELRFKDLLLDQKDAQLEIGYPNLDFGVPNLGVTSPILKVGSPNLDLDDSMLSFKRPNFHQKDPMERLFGSSFYSCVSNLNPQSPRMSVRSPILATILTY